jgi:hypothetical protein
MLLETLDLRRNDVLIYSQNRFNFNDNFKIIYKNEKVKQRHHISYFDVCSFVKDPSPKNLIVYRLMTNVNHLDAYSTKYGYFIKVNSKVELIYFDPIYAIKDLRHLRFDLDPDQFRFKIQQVGLTSLTKKETEPNFAEVYSFDLKAFEAQNQNDKIFADAIFLFDDIRDEEGRLEQVDPVEKVEARYAGSQKAFSNLNQIAEERTNKPQELMRVDSPNSEKLQDLREEIVDLLKQALGIEKEKAAIDIVSKRIDSIDPRNLENSVNNLFDLFKSTSKSNELAEREKESVILKFVDGPGEGRK